MRGAVSGGMALALHELALTRAFDDVYGSSAGSISAAWLVSATPESLVGWAEPSYTKMMIRRHGPLRRQPVVNTRTLVEVVYTQHSPMDFASIVDSEVHWHPLATDAHTGKAVDLFPYIRTPSDVQTAIRASASLPLLAGAPVEMAGRRFFDAGVAEPLPYRTAIAHGATHVLVLRSRRPHDPPRVSNATPAAARLLFRSYGHDFRRALILSSPRYQAADQLLNGHRPFPARYPPIASIRPSPSSPTVRRLSSDAEVLVKAMAAGGEAVRAAFGERLSPATI